MFGSYEVSNYRLNLTVLRILKASAKSGCPMTRPELCTERVEAPGPRKLSQSTAHSRGQAGAPLLPGTLSCLILPPGQVVGRPNYENQLSPFLSERPQENGSIPRTKPGNCFIRQQTPYHPAPGPHLPQPKGHAHKCATSTVAPFPGVSFQKVQGQRHPPTWGRSGEAPS